MGHGAVDEERIAMRRRQPRAIGPRPDRHGLAVREIDQSQPHRGWHEEHRGLDPEKLGIAVEIPQRVPPRAQGLRLALDLELDLLFALELERRAVVVDQRDVGVEVDKNAQLES